MTHRECCEALANAEAALLKANADKGDKAREAEALSAVNKLLSAVLATGAKFSTIAVGGNTLAQIRIGTVIFEGAHQDCFRATVMAAKDYFEHLKED